MGRQKSNVNYLGDHLYARWTWTTYVFSVELRFLNKRLTHRVSLGCEEEIPYLRYHLLGSVRGFPPLQIELYSLAQNRTVGKIFASRLVREKWIPMLTHMHGKTLCKV